MVKFQGKNIPVADITDTMMMAFLSEENINHTVSREEFETLKVILWLIYCRKLTRVEEFNPSEDTE